MVITFDPLPQNEADRLNTLVNFQPEFTPLHGQFSAGDNMLGRFLCAQGRIGVIPQWSTTPFSLPYEVEVRARRIAAAGLMPVTICYSPQAEARLRGLLVELSRKGDDAADPLTKALLARAFEKLKRVCGVIAVWDQPEQPLIELSHVEWALQLIEASDAAMVAFVGDELHDGAVQANAAAVRKAISGLLDRDPATLSKGDARYHEAGAVTRSAALRRTKLAVREFDEAVAHLLALGDIAETVDCVPGGRGAGATTRVLSLT